MNYSPEEYFDEYKFNRIESNDNQYFHRLPNKSLNPRYITKTLKFPERNVWFEVHLHDLVKHTFE